MCHSKSKNHTEEECGKCERRQKWMSAPNACPIDRALVLILPEQKGQIGGKVLVGMLVRWLDKRCGQLVNSARCSATTASCSSFRESNTWIRALQGFYQANAPVSQPKFSAYLKAFGAPILLRCQLDFVQCSVGLSLFL